MPSIEVALRMDAPRFPSTNDLLRAFNNVVCQITGGHRFISMFYGKLCPQSCSLEYTNAGHNPPLLIRAGLDPSPLDKGDPCWVCFLIRSTRVQGSTSAREVSSFCTPGGRSRESRRRTVLCRTIVKDCQVAFAPECEPASRDDLYVRHPVS